MNSNDHDIDDEIKNVTEKLYDDGIAVKKGAFARKWVKQLHQDIDVLFQEALSSPGRALNRGANRFYVEIHPERLRGFIDLASHPWVTSVCEAMLGSNYRIVEVGFDIPQPGAEVQPWHRDFPAPDSTLKEHRLSSLAFNITTVDVTEEMGPFEIALGTQWDDPSEFKEGIFPPTTCYARYESLAQRKYPQMGDISVRTALTIHRGTANRSPVSRPVLVLGVDAPDDINGSKHDLQVTRSYFERLPVSVKKHLDCRVMDKLEPVVQAHQIAGLAQSTNGNTS